MNRAEALDRLATARVGRFASVTPEGTPHIVPVTFAIVEGTVVHMIDQKPKTTSRLRRLSNVEATPVASLLVDRYDEDWSRLWWVRADGAVRVETGGDPWQRARDGLAEKYEQYRLSPPQGAAVYLTIDRLTHWSSS
jgi:PPOX class probable F420-dependent enzyme